ncbi:hypothetical protein GCM10022419_056710 [Nonomuraea rosea]|uniref:Uncharacterized protein n=1 Tax=Nonomuraea rosea TaxID=638574 RepID=A0ABP6XQU5_9ACTN
MYTRTTACPGTSGPVWLRLPDEEMTTTNLILYLIVRGATITLD